MEIALLNDKKSIKQLVEVDINKSILEFIEVELSKDEFNFIVTAENVPVAKKIMSDLNKNIKFIDTFRKDKVSAESADIDVFKSNVKDYLALIDAKREEIKKNVEFFERETKASITKELSLYSQECIEAQNIRDNFIDVNIVDLIVLGSVTSKGALTKKAKEAIDGRVMVCKSKQDKYDMRLKDLEIESRRAGLEAILTITHVQGIISLDDDAEYQTKLSELISHEIERQNAVKASVQKQADEKALQKANQSILNEQNRIKEIFYIVFEHMTIEQIDSNLINLREYHFTQHGVHESFARDIATSQIAKLNNIRNGLIQSAALAKSQKVEVVHETIPADENNQDAPKVEYGKKIVRINAIFEVEVPGHVDSGAVLNKVRSRLSQCDINSDTLKSLEVI